MVARSHFLGLGSSFAFFRRRWRDCAYDEGEEVIRLGYDHEARVREQLDYYRSTGFPERAGLIAGGLVRRHNDDDVVAPVTCLHPAESARFGTVPTNDFAASKKTSAAQTAEQAVVHLVNRCPFTSRLELSPGPAGALE